MLACYSTACGEVDPGRSLQRPSCFRSLVLAAEAERRGLERVQMCAQWPAEFTQLHQRSWRRKLSDVRLDDKVVVVTGGARGIGAAIAERFQGAGARVVCLVRRAPDAPRRGVRYVKADISIESEVKSAFDDIDRAEGRVDILVNNAGIQRVGAVGRLSSDDWNAVVGTNLTGVFLVSTEVIPRMARDAQGGSIVNIASTAAFLGLPGRGPYCAAKAGLLGLTRVMALEGASAGIRVNAVAPGFTSSDLIQSGLAGGWLKPEWMTERVPMGRLGEPNEIADVVVAVASPAFSYVTGQAIVVDGGWAVQGISDAPDSLQDWRDPSLRAEPARSDS